MNNDESRPDHEAPATEGPIRRDFLRQAAGTALAMAGAPAIASGAAIPEAREGVHVVSFDGPDALYHGHGWESLNPGYWKIEDGALRRRLTNVGDRARATGFPFHEATAGRVLEAEYDPSLPAGILYRRDWKPGGRFAVAARFTFRGHRPDPPEGDDPSWKMYQDGYGLMGLAFGAKSLFESFRSIRHAVQVVWADDQTLRLLAPTAGGARKKEGQPEAITKVPAPRLEPGDTVSIRLEVAPQADGQALVTATLEAKGRTAEVRRRMPAKAVEGYVGVVGRGLIDFEVDEFAVEPGDNRPLEVGMVDCPVCYCLGDSLETVNGRWQVRFVALFASGGERAEIRIADRPDPEDGWRNVPVAGSSPIVDHDWRRNTAVIRATLPADPSQTTLYYTIWKDGKDVTADPRIGTAATGPGTGLVGDVPARGDYVGRLPRLAAPYKLCGLSCHAINSGLQQRTDRGLQILGGGDDWPIRDQPTVGAYAHLDDYDFQVMLWEDDVWYMELVLYPPSPDDAYKVVTTTLGGPTSRWQLMRHWNVLNPGDHDYGMDDVKGPEQLAVRRLAGLGQDPEYMRRNFQIVHHLVTGAEEVDPLANPKTWRAWTMPRRDFTLLVLDARLWRSSQDVDIWDDAGWGHVQSIYDRTDPTRSLLGEEQFAWLRERLATDAAPLICLTGLNGLHTIWSDGAGRSSGEGAFDQRDRVAADYAGWVKAGSDRVLGLLGGRDGVVTVYGDVHNGSILRNLEHRVIECSFGPIGRSGGRAVIPGFGPKMADWDGRALEVDALYHKEHANPRLEAHAPGEPFYWNFLEMEFDARGADPKIGLRLRNLIDTPADRPRGGGSLETVAAATGRLPSGRLPGIKTLPNADVRFALLDGRPIRGARSLDDGLVPVAGLVGVEPGTTVVVTATDGGRAESILVKTTDARGRTSALDRDTK